MHCVAPPIHSSHDPWQGKVDGNTGLVPANYIRVIEDVAVYDTEDDIQSSVRYIFSVGCVTYLLV